MTENLYYITILYCILIKLNKNHFNSKIREIKAINFVLQLILTFI